MRYTVKWRANGNEALRPEVFSSKDEAQDRVRELLASRIAEIDVWNEEETWQIVTPAGVSEWCQQ